MGLRTPRGRIEVPSAGPFVRCARLSRGSVCCRCSGRRYEGKFQKTAWHLGCMITLGLMSSARRIRFLFWSRVAVSTCALLVFYACATQGGEINPQPIPPADDSPTGSLSPGGGSSIPVRPTADASISSGGGTGDTGIPPSPAHDAGASGVSEEAGTVDGATPDGAVRDGGASTSEAGNP